MAIKVIIPAREGSKGLPGKNLKKLCGKPLIDYTILKALELFDSSSIILTSDSSQILQRGKEYGIQTILRPRELAKDNSPIIETILHASNYSEKYLKMKCDQIMLLQPTYPIRDVVELKKAIKFFKEKKLNALVSVVEMEEHPCECIYLNKSDFKDWNFLKDPNNNTNRQSYEDNYFFINGNFYIANLESLKIFKSFLFGQTRFFKCDGTYKVDIDNKYDFEFAEFCLTKLNKYI